MERIHVTVRARPLMPDEAKVSKLLRYTYDCKLRLLDRIFEQDCRTLEVYHARTRDIVAAAVRGFNGTVFAYGQTNSGKTHTMRGSPTEPGVIPLAVNDLFDIIQGEGEREFLLRMSYMEIYNEDVNDLLVPEHRKLQIHENLERGIYVAGLREEIVASPQQVLNLMDFGESHRHIGETNMNLHSSRSHTIFRMIIESRDKTEDGNNDNSCDAVRVSVLNLVDLAGSERAAKTGAEGVRLKEGSHINKSLMTLGTVIKKLSEGAESQGGHVPYRDSKLTRILQPALGGNANTAIICNITLAQIHTDETKSSLQFASRALRVTNCARVNEILTDAALLKRQKKEIEELRAKLQANHSEHLEEEILGLRNTLLQSELERECIALELEEEKKAQAEREKMLQEQAKKIQNLSSMVLYSSRDEIHQHIKKSKRRDTWCPGNLSRESLQVVCSNVHSKASAVKSARPDRDIGPLLPFEELVNESAVADESCKQDEDGRDHSLEIDNLPDPCALLNITSRRKMPLKKKSSSVGYNELEELQAEYEDLFLKFESQRTTSEIQINILTRKLAEANLSDSLKTDVPSTYNVNESTFYGDKRTSVRESEAKLVIQQLQEKIKMLEVQKSSNRQSLDNLVELAVEQDICAREKLEEFQEELLNAREEARVAQEQLASSEFTGRIDLSEVEEVVNELQRTKRVVDNALSLVDDFFMMQSAIHTELLDFKASVRHISEQHYSVIQNRQKLQCCMRVRVSEVENEKLLMDNKSVDLQRQLKEIREFSEQQHLEKLELFTHIQTMENELSSLSSSSLVREKESLRKDLEKTKTKLKETECKLKNAIQEKTKLEGEKAVAEREVKRLHGQNTLLERDRRRDSVAEKTSRVVDPKMGKGPGVSFEHMQEDYQKLEVLAFEMETAIASLEEELATASMEKEEALARNENLASELEAVSERFSKSSTELNELHEEISGLRSVLGESKVKMEKMEGSIKILLEEKEELAMQLTDSLLAMEEEKAIWSAKEKASVEAIEEKVKLYNAEIALLSKEMSEERDNLMTQIEEQQRHVVEVEHLRKNCNDALLEAKAQVEELTKIISNIKAKVHTDEVNNNKEKAKLRMRLRGTQAQLDAFRFRYNQALNDSDIMDKKFAEASANLKDRLASKGLEVLTLKKQLAAAMKQ